MKPVLATVDVAKIKILTLLLVLGIIVSGCMPEMATQRGGVPTPMPVTKTATSVVLLDTSGSVLQTDIPVMAQNKLTDLVKTMPVNSRVVLRGVNSNVTAMCQDLVIRLPQQPSGPVEDQVRQGNEAAVPEKFKSYLDCSTQQGTGGTEFWAGLAETYDFYRDAQIFAYGDTCENVTIRPGTCDTKRLSDPEYPRTVVTKLSKQGLIPQLDPSMSITFIGIGRNTSLPGPAVRALRRIATLWAGRADVTINFDTK